MTDVSILAIDLAKHVFQVCVTTGDGTVIFNRKYTRAKLQQLLMEHPPCMVAMEACATSHHWGRFAGSHGHEIRLIPPIYVKPFVKRLSYDFSCCSAKNEPPRASSNWRAAAVAGSQKAWS